MPSRVTRTRGAGWLPTLGVALLALMLMTKWRVVGAEETKEKLLSIKEGDREFVAYDCSAPLNLTTVTPAIKTDCLLPTPQVKVKPIRYRVVQEAKYTKIKLFRCSATVSRIAVHCTWEHRHGYLSWMYKQMLLDEEWKFKEKKTLTIEECRKLWKGEYVDPYHTDRKYKVKVPGSSTVITHSAGSSRRKNGFVECAGNEEANAYLREGPDHWGAEHYQVPDQRVSIPGAVVTDYTDFHLEEVEAIKSRGGELTLVRDQIKLPCYAGATECEVEDVGTFFWRLPSKEATCHLFSARAEMVEGLEIEDANGRPVFYAEETMIRLEKRDAISKCGSVLHRTDFDGLYLTEDNRSALLRRMLPLSEMSIISYVNQQDRFLYQEIIEEIRKQLWHSRQRQCQRELGRRRGEYARQAAEQQAVLDGETAMIAPNYFVTSAGEVWYAYHCRPIVVKADPRADCYSALPVALREEDVLHYLRNRGERISDEPQTNLTLEFFLEPRSHRLSTVAAPVECAPPLLPHYQNRHGQWLAWDGPDLHLVNEPLELESLDLDFDSLPQLGKEFDFPDGGLYSGEAVKRMESFSHAPRAIQGLVAVLNRQNKNSRVDSPRRVSDIFPDIPDFPTMSFVNWFWNFLDTYGRMCSVVIGTGLIFRFGTWVAGVALRLFATPVTGSILSHIFSAFFPAVRDFLRDRWLTSAATQGPSNNLTRPEATLSPPTYQTWEKLQRERMATTPTPSAPLADGEEDVINQRGLGQTLSRVRFKAGGKGGE